MNLTYFLDNKLGGVTSLNYNLAMNCPANDFVQSVIHLDFKEGDYPRANIKFPVQDEKYFSYSYRENFYAVLKRLAGQVPTQTSACIFNYNVEMALHDHYPFTHTTFQLVHDDYNVGLALKYEHVVDAFVCHNSVIAEELRNRLPQRKDEIFLLPHGVAVPDRWRNQQEPHKPLRLVFLGRMVESKGVHDLPVIAAILAKKGFSCEWLCIGSGPELPALRNAWDSSIPVRFVAPTTNKEVVELCTQQDVFVLPTKFEGSPVSLIETMSVGLVPVISKIPGGITDIVTPDIGYTIGMNDVQGFADAIESLYLNRSVLEEKSARCRQKIIQSFDVKITAKRYFDLFARHESFYKPKKIKKLKVGARLDSPWIPDVMTTLIRTMRKQWKYLW